MAIEEDKEQHTSWGGVAGRWYTLASDRHPAIGRLNHHLGILERPSVRKMFFYAKSLTCLLPFPNAKDSMAVLCGPILHDTQLLQNSDEPAEARIMRFHALLFGRATLLPDAYVRLLLWTMDTSVPRSHDIKELNGSQSLFPDLQRTTELEGRDEKSSISNRYDVPYTFQVWDRAERAMWLALLEVDVEVKLNTNVLAEPNILDWDRPCYDRTSLDVELKDTHKQYPLIAGKAKRTIHDTAKKTMKVDCKVRAPLSNPQHCDSISHQAASAPDNGSNAKRAGSEAVNKMDAVGHVSPRINALRHSMSGGYKPYGMIVSALLTAFLPPGVSAGPIRKPINNPVSHIFASIFKSAAPLLALMLALAFVVHFFWYYRKGPKKTRYWLWGAYAGATLWLMFYCISDEDYGIQPLAFVLWSGCNGNHVYSAWKDLVKRAAREGIVPHPHRYITFVVIGACILALLGGAIGVTMQNEREAEAKWLGTLIGQVYILLPLAVCTTSWLMLALEYSLQDYVVRQQVPAAAIAEQGVVEGQVVGLDELVTRDDVGRS